MDGLQREQFGRGVFTQQVLADLGDLVHPDDALVNLILVEGSVGWGGGVQVIQFMGQQAVQIEGGLDFDGHGVSPSWGSIHYTTCKSCEEKRKCRVSMTFPMYFCTGGATWF